MRVPQSYIARALVSHKQADVLDSTVTEYNLIIAYLIHVIEENWDNIATLEHPHEQQRYVEKLVHKTTQNTNPAYADFDEEFNQLPSSIRRDAITAAIGDYKSYNTQHEQWRTDGKHGKEPTLTYERHQTPSFFNKSMFKYNKGCLQNIQLKLYDGHAWRWFTIRIRNQDARYVLRHSLLPNVKIKSPTILKRGGQWFISFRFEFNTPLTDAELYEQMICAVDLGVNTDATCCIMDASGTVHDRIFLNNACIKGRMYHLLGKLRKSQSKGARKLKKQWRRINQLNEELTRWIVRGIIDFAVKWSCTHIVCEFLNIQGKIRGSRKYRLKQWRKRGIYHHLCDQAHVWGMRVRQVCAWNTSRLAFDGSGRVQRGSDITGEDGSSLGYSYSWVRFSSGKLYHSDLNACYNIGARYFTREMLKALDVSPKSGHLANVLGGSGGSAFTLSSLINLNTVLKEPSAFEVLVSDDATDDAVAAALAVVEGA